MRHSTPGKTPSSKRLDGQAELKQRRASSRDSKPSPDSSKPTAQTSTELASLLAADETRLIIEADNVGMDQLVAALTRIPIRRRKNKTSKSAT